MSTCPGTPPRRAHLPWARPTRPWVTACARPGRRLHQRASRWHHGPRRRQLCGGRPLPTYPLSRRPPRRASLAWPRTKGEPARPGQTGRLERAPVLVGHSTRRRTAPPAPTFLRGRSWVGRRRVEPRGLGPGLPSAAARAGSVFRPPGRAGDGVAIAGVGRIQLCCACDADPEADCRSRLASSPDGGKRSDGRRLHLVGLDAYASGGGQKDAGARHDGAADATKDGNGDEVRGAPGATLPERASRAPPPGSSTCRAGSRRCAPTTPRRPRRCT